VTGTFALLALTATCLQVPLDNSDGSPAIPLTAGSAVRFATPQEAAQALTRRDDFTRSLSLFDRQSRLQTDGPAPLDALLKFTTQQIVPWTADEQQKLTRAWQSIRNRLQPFQLPLPATILLVKTSGREEGNAAYCRGAAIVLPQRVLQRSAETLESLLIHELFHVLSSQNPPLRDKLYAIIGFHPCPPVELPADLRDRKITNPDGPLARHYIDIDLDGRRLPMVPVLYARVERYDPQLGGPFFRFLEFRLMAIQREGDSAQPLVEEGQPVLTKADENESFFRQVGRNTDYILHPDEILADNFVALVRGTRELKSPQIVEQMRKVLAAPSKPSVDSQP
jgi:hypothetical protein